MVAKTVVWQQHYCHIISNILAFITTIYYDDVIMPYLGSVLAV